MMDIQNTFSVSKLSLSHMLNVSTHCRDPDTVLCHVVVVGTWNIAVFQTTRNWTMAFLHSSYSLPWTNHTIWVHSFHIRCSILAKHLNRLPIIMYFLGTSPRWFVLCDIFCTIQIFGRFFVRLFLFFNCPTVHLLNITSLLWRRDFQLDIS